MSDRRQEILPAQRTDDVSGPGDEDSPDQEQRPGMTHFGPDSRHIRVAKEEPQQSEREEKNQDRADA